MNPLAHYEYRGLKRLADLNIQNERDRCKRVFGRDITNL